MAISMPVNALAGIPIPRPSLENEIGRLVRSYGGDLVRAEVLKQTKKKKGRKQELDWQILGPQIIAVDAQNWMDGKDPMAVRSNYSIAKEFSENHPGHNATATFRRIQKKLSHRRRWYWMTHAYFELADDRPFNQYFEVASALTEIEGPWRKIVDRDVEAKLGLLERFRFSFGDPDPSISFNMMRERLDAMDMASAMAANQLYHQTKGIGSLLRNAARKIS